MGDYTFNPQTWPDPKKMVDHLAGLGIRVMVSAWPFILKAGARASEEIARNPQLVVHDTRGKPVPWPDSVCGAECYLYDASSNASRHFIFSMLKDGYVKYGIKNFWFDAAEPENLGGINHTVDGIVFNNPLGQPSSSLYEAGENEQVGMLFPWWHSKMVHDGLISEFPNEVPVTLARSAWAGSQRWGATVWNGDLQASWTNLKKTIVAGLSTQLSGLAWWTHDIGAIVGCDVSDPDYRELLIRWFQFGLVSPIFRQHGSRPVEPWLLQRYGPCKDKEPTVCGPSGNETYSAILTAMSFREKLRPYVMSLMREVAANGEPVNRPLSWDFPADSTAWFVTDELMFGPRYLVAPITDLGFRSRLVYFPHGPNCNVWLRVAANLTVDYRMRYMPGSTMNVSVALDELAIFECLPNSASSFDSIVV
jgi:alpha-D-xyloside xylohydrolase